jgi:antitoxin component of MazEF toxin-antitoxin module
VPVFESERKVQVFGSSLAVTLPALFVKACEIEKGSILNVVYGLNGILVASSVAEPESLMKHLLDIVIRLEQKIKDQDSKVNEEMRAHST